ncbi:MAG: hypothetical protein NTY64_14140, partial [Deltaproteobacteria bacterium]|nr:hypothetical protein [Deltaproteobacteria bacterium]
IELKSSDLLISSIAPVVVSVGIYLCVFVYLQIAKRSECKGFYLPAMFSNAGNMALPIALLAYGEEGISSALIYMVVVGLLIFSLGIFIVTSEFGFHHLYRQYVLYATIIGLLVNFFRIGIPQQIIRGLDMIAGIPIPMLLLTLGYNLTKFTVRSLRLGLIGSFFRIGMGFLISWLCFIKILGLATVTGKTIVLLSSMPAALIVFPIAEQNGADPEVVASIIVVSTVLGLFSIPLVIWFLG